MYICIHVTISEVSRSPDAGVRDEMSAYQNRNLRFDMQTATSEF